MAYVWRATPLPCYRIRTTAEVAGPGGALKQWRNPSKHWVVSVFGPMLGLMPGQVAHLLYPLHGHDRARRCMRLLWADPACAKPARGELAALGRAVKQSLGARPLPRGRPGAGAAAGAVPVTARAHDPRPSGTL